MKGAAGPRAHFVVLVGPDGVGKTTVARSLLSRHLGSAAYVHFRPPILRQLPTEASPGSAGDKEPPSGPAIFGWVRLLRSLAVFWLGYLLRIEPALRRGVLVVGDRWGYGYVGQPRALRFVGPRRLAMIAVRLLPRPDLVVLLSAPPPLIHQRKQELSLADIEEELERWRSLPVGRLVELDAAAPPEHLAEAIEAALAGRSHHRGFPPRAPFVGIPTTSRRGAIAALSLHPASRGRARFARGVTAAWIWVAGPRSLPFPGILPPLDLGSDTWRELEERCAAVVGRFDSVAFSGQRQPERRGGAVLLLRSGRPVGFVKVRWDGAEALAHEGRAMDLVSAAAPRSFRIPSPLAWGAIDRLGFLLTEPLPAGLHRPAKNPPLPALLAEVRSALSSMTCPPDVPEHWEPMHGDLAPWNLRALGRRLFLVDWEEAGWGPPEADLAYFQATSASLWGGEVTASPEARSFWVERLRAWLPGRKDDLRLTERLLSLLEQ